MSAYLRHTANIIVGCQILGLIRDLTALGRNVFGLEEKADQQAVSIFRLLPQFFSPYISAHCCLSSSADWRISSSPRFSAPHHFFLLFLFISILSHPTSLPTPPLPQPEPRRAGGLSGCGPRWRAGDSASSWSLSLQDGRTALLWPIWPRPVLAPVCDYGAAGGWRSWHTARTLPVHSRPGD